MPTLSRTQISVNQFAELVYNLMENLPSDTDMQIIESATKQVMKHNELNFKPYDQFLNELDGDISAKYWMNFDSTEEYFFDRINSQAITLNMVKSLIESTVIF